MVAQSRLQSGAAGDRRHVVFEVRGQGPASRPRRVLGRRH